MGGAALTLQNVRSVVSGVTGPTAGLWHLQQANYRHHHLTGISQCPAWRLSVADAPVSKTSPSNRRRNSID